MQTEVIYGNQETEGRASSDGIPGAQIQRAATQSAFSDHGPMVLRFQITTIGKTRRRGDGHFYYRANLPKNTARARPT
jgi:hypothetical protein